MSKPEQRNLERVRYWQGQMLRSRDFLDIEGVEAQRRWWHNRALHNAYGVAEGLTSKLITLQQVSVSPGIAYDCFGRELILEKTISVPLPSNVPKTFTGSINLLMRYQPRSGGLRPDETSEICWPAGCISSGTAEFVWKVSCRPDAGDGVVVGAIAYNDGRVTKREIKYSPITVQPLSRPLLASGATIAGNTPWEVWVAGYRLGHIAAIIAGVQTWIDTSAAGFTQVPCYFASMEGPVWDPQTRQLVPAIFPSIADESVTGFYFRLWLTITVQSPFTAELQASAAVLAPTYNLVTDPSQFTRFARRQGLYVSWIGCQMLSTPSSCCGQQDNVTPGPGSVLNS